MAGVGTATPGTASPRTTREVPRVNRGWVVAAAAAWAVLLLAVLRVWLPAVLPVPDPTVEGRSLGQLGLLVLTPLVSPAVIVFALRRLRPDLLFAWALIGLAACRLALQFVDGGGLQTSLATLGVALAVLALGAMAAGVPSGHLARLGILAGLALSAAAHAALGTYGAVWRDDPLTTTVVTAGCVAAALAALRARAVPLWWPTPLGSGVLAPVWTRGPAWPWWVVGPLVALVATVVAVPSRLELAIDATPAQAAVGTTVAGGLAVAVGVLARRAGGTVGATGAAAVLLAIVFALPGQGVPAAIGQLGLLVAAGVVVGALGRTPGDSGPRRRAAVATGSMVVAGVAVTGSLFTAELAARSSERVWPALAALAIAGLGGGAAWTTRSLRPQSDPVGRPLLAIAAATLLLAGLAGAVAPTSAPAPGTAPTTADDSLRVATFNVASGYGTRGRFDPDAVAEVLREAEVDLVVLTEVDRGWLVAGGHDLLRLLAARLDLPHAAFAPSAAPSWGNAVLSRHPLLDLRRERLPRGLGTSRSWLSSTVDLGDGQRLGLVVAQMSAADEQAAVRSAQARALAGEVSRLRARDLPTVLLGDLGAEPDAPELEPLGFLEDAATRARATDPVAPPPSWRDRVLIAGGLEVVDARVPSPSGTRHRPVIVDLRLSG